jgi:hypothetical protein
MGQEPWLCGVPVVVSFLSMLNGAFVTCAHSPTATSISLKKCSALNNNEKSMKNRLVDRRNSSKNQNSEAVEYT